MKKELSFEDVVLTPIPSNMHDYIRYGVDANNGRVWDYQKERWLVSNPNSNGYCYVGLVDKETGKSKSYGLHRVILASSMGLPIEEFKRGKWEVDHVDDNPSNNEVTNLQLATRQSQYKTSTIVRMSKPKPRLKESDVCEILEQLVEWQSDQRNKLSDFIWMMSEAYNIGYRGMWNIVYGKSYKDLYKNLHTSTI